MASTPPNLNELPRLEDRLDPQTGLSEGQKRSPTTAKTDPEPDLLPLFEDRLTQEELAEIPHDDSRMFERGATRTDMNPADFPRFTEFRQGENFLERRAQSQTAWDLISGAAAQTAGILLGGTTETVGYLLEFPFQLGAAAISSAKAVAGRDEETGFWEAVASGDREFGNSLLGISEAGRNFQEFMAEWRPVHMTERAQRGWAGPGSGLGDSRVSGFFSNIIGDRTWWASHAPSIFSSATLLIPGFAVGAGLRMGTRALGMARRSQDVTQLLGTAVMSRHMYSSMESAELFHRLEQDGRALGMNASDARDYAASAAGRNYTLGYLNLWKDVLGWGIVFKGVNHANRALRHRLGELSKNAPAGSRIHTITDHVNRYGVQGARAKLKAKGIDWRHALALAFGEGIEEVNIQYQKKTSEDYAKSQLGLTDWDGRPMSQKWLEHVLDDRHTWDSFFWGAFGGLTFSQLGPAAYNKVMSGQVANERQQLSRLIDQISTAERQFKAYGDAIAEGNEGAAERIRHGMIHQIGMEGTQKGNLDLSIELFEGLAEMTPEQLESVGYDQSMVEHARETADMLKEYGQMFNRHMDQATGEHSESIANWMTMLEQIAKTGTKLSDKYTARHNQRKQENPTYQNLSDVGKRRFDIREEIMALQQTVAMLKDNPPDYKNDPAPEREANKKKQESVIAEYEKRLSELAEEHKELAAQSKEALSSEEHRRETAIVNVRQPDNQSVRDKTLGIYFDSERDISLSRLAWYQDPKNQAALNKYITEQNKKAVKQISDEVKRVQEQKAKKEKQDKESNKRFTEDQRTSLHELGYKDSKIAELATEDIEYIIEHNLRPDEYDMYKRIEAEADFAYDPEGPELDIDAEMKAAEQRMPTDPPPLDPVGEGTDPDTAGNQDAPDMSDHELHMSLEGLGFELKDIVQMSREERVFAVKEGLSADEYKALDRSKGKKQDKPAQQSQKKVTVDGTDYRVDNDGNVSTMQGDPVSETIANKVLAKQTIKESPSRRVTYKGNDYVVLDDGRIISLSKTTAGNEVYSKEGPDRSAIYSAAGLGTSESLKTLHEQSGKPLNQQPEVGAEVDQQVIKDHDSKAYHQDDSGDLGILDNLSGVWSSARNPLATIRTKSATEFFENPDNQVVGRTLEFEIMREAGDEFAHPLEQKIMKNRAPIRKNGSFYEARIGGEWKRFTPGNLPMRLNVLEQDGTVVHIDGEAVRMYLRKVDKMDDPFVNTFGRKEEYKQSLNELKFRVLKASNDGFTIRTKITGRAPGHVIRDGSLTTNVLEYSKTAGMKKPLLAIADYDGNPKSTDGHVKEFAFLRHQHKLPPGQMILGVPFRGDGRTQYYPAYLNPRHLTDREANIVADMYIALLEGRPENSPANIEGFEGLSIRNVLDLMVYHGDPTLDYINHPNKLKHERILAIKNEGETNTLFIGNEWMTQENLADPDIREKIAHHVKTHKKRQVDMRGIGGRHALPTAIPGQPASPGQLPASFQWFGQKIDMHKPDSYLDFIFNDQGDSPAAVTISAVADPRPLVQNNITYSTEIEVLSQSEAVKPLVDPDTGKTKTGKQSMTAAELRKKLSKKKDRPDAIPPDDINRYKAFDPNNTSVISMENEYEAIKNILPKGLETSLVDTVFDYGGVKAFGVFTGAGIILARNAPRGTGYHEAFHAIFSVSLTEVQQSRLLQEAAQIWPEDASNKRRLEEHLADSFADYVNSDGRLRLQRPEADGFFAKLFQWVRDFFSSELQVNHIYEQMAQGYYADRPAIRSFAETLSPRYKKFSSFYAPGVKESLSLALIARLSRDVDFRGQEGVPTVDLGNLEGYISGYVDWFESPDVFKPEVALLWDLPLREPLAMQELQEEVINRLNTIGIRAVGDAVPESLEAGERGNLFVNASYEYSNRDSASANVKLLLHTIPKLNSITPTGESYDYAISPITGLPEFMDFERVWTILERSVSNITPIANDQGAMVSVFDQMLQKIESLESFEPSFLALKNILNDLPQRKKNEFHKAMKKAHVSPKSVLFSLGENPSFSFQDSDVLRTGSMLRRKWKSRFINRMFTASEGDLVFDAKKAKNLVTKYATLRLKAALAETNPELFIETYTSLMDEIGIEFDTEAILYQMVIENKEFGEVATDLVNASTRIFDPKVPNSIPAMLAAHQRGMDSGDLIDRINPFESLQTESGTRGQLVRELAQMYYMAHPEIGESTVFGAENKTSWLYTNPNFFYDTINRLKNDPEYARELMQDRMHNSLFLEQLSTSKQVRDNADMSIFLNSRRLDRGDDGRALKNVHPAEKLIIDFNAVLKGFYPSLNLADASTSYFLQGLEIPDGLVDYERAPADDPSARDVLTITDKAVDMFMRYFQNEYYRVLSVQNDLRPVSEGGLPDSELIQWYHYTNEQGPPDRTSGNGLKFYFFPDFNNGQNEALSELYKQMYHPDGYLLEPTSDAAFQQIQELAREPIRDILEEHVRGEFRFLRQHDMLEGDKLRKFLDQNAVVNRYGSYGQTNRFKAVGDISLKGLIADIEQILLFHKDPAFYKDFKDFRKRTTGANAFGTGLNTADPNVPQTYQMVVSRDPRPDMPHSIRQWIDFMKKSPEKFSAAQIKQMERAYENLEPTDAQGWITLKRARDILRGEGKWQESWNPYFDQMARGEPITDPEMSRRLAALFTPIKGVHFEYVRENGTKRPVYIKYSQSVLLPEFTQRVPELERMREWMENNEIDEHVYGTGAKIGSFVPLENYTADTHEFSPVFDRSRSEDPGSPVIMELSNDFWRRQQETPYKGISEYGLEATQPRKNFLAAIQSGYEYRVSSTETLNAQQMYSQYNEVLRAQVRKGIASLSSRLDMTETQDGWAVNDYNALSEILQEHGVSRRYAENIIEGLETTEDGQFIIPLSLSPRNDAVQAVFFALFESAAVKTDTFGGALYQVSGKGIRSYREYTAQERESFDLYTDNLEGPRLNEKGEVEFAQVLLPSWFRDAIPNAHAMSKQALNKWLQDNPEMFQFIGYRIPNQGLVSIEALEVAGFIPAEMGDAIVVYEELTIKNDSDFDIDKMYVNIPNFRVRSGKPEIVPFHNISTTDQEAMRKLYEDRSRDQTSYIRFLEHMVDKNLTELTDSEINIYQAIENESPLTEGLVGIEEKLQQAREVMETEYSDFEKWFSENRGKNVHDVNSLKAIQNRRLALQKAMLSNPMVMAESMLPLVDRSVIDYAEKMAEYAGLGQEQGGLSEYGLTSQIQIGSLFRAGKQNIGIKADHLSAHNFSVHTGLSVYGALPYTNTIYRQRGKSKKQHPYTPVSSVEAHGEQVTRVLATYMTGFLDIAKDPWIVWANINATTGASAAFMVRSGFGGRRTISFFMQEAVRRAVDIEQGNQTGFRGSDYGFQAAIQEAMQEYRDKITEALGEDNWENAKKSGAIPFRNGAARTNGLLSMSHLEDMLKVQGEGGRDLQYFVDQFHILQDYAEIRKMANLVNSATVHTKFDTGMPVTIHELAAEQFRYEKVMTTKNLHGMDSYMSNTFLGQMREVREVAQDLARRLFVEYSPATETTARIFGHFQRDQVGRVTDPKLIRTIYNGVMSFIIEQSPIARTAEQRKAMFFGSNTLASQLSQIQENADQYGLSNNDFLQYLTPLIQGTRPSFILGNFREKGPIVENRLTRGWKAMLGHPEPKIRQFAEDLVYMAYVTSGQRRSLYTFHDLIPVEYLRESGLSEFVKKYTDTVMNSGEVVSDITNEILANEFDSGLIPYVKFDDISKPQYAAGTVTFQIDAQKVTKEQPEYMADAEPEILPYVRTTIKGESVLLQYFPELSSAETFRYGRVNRKGYHDRGTHIYEYGEGPSMIEANNEFIPLQENDYFSENRPDNIHPQGQPKDVPGNMFIEESSDDAQTDMINRLDNPPC